MIMVPETTVQVAPGIWVDTLQHKVSVEKNKRLMLLDKKGWDLLGLTPRHERTLRRLHESGFIAIVQLSPRVWLLDVDSWEKHMDKVIEDPWFWEGEGRNIKQYRGAK